MWKKGYRTLTKNKRKVIPILVLMIASIAFGGVMFDIQDARGRIINEVIDKTNFSDGFVYLDSINKSLVDPVLNNLADEYFEEYETRIVLPIDFEIDGDDYEGLLIGINTSLDEHINALLDTNKKELDEDEYVLNWGFADWKGVDKGDEIKLRFGFIENEEEVKDIGYTPEFTFVPLHENVILPSMDPYPVFFVDIDYISNNFLGSSVPIINQILYKLENEDEQEDLEEEMKDSSISIFIDKIITQEDHPFIKSMREDEASDRELLMMFLIVFLAGAILVLIVVFHRLIESDLKSVSVFQGLGATRGEIIGSYLIFNLLLFFIAFIAGSLLSFFIGIPYNNLLASVMKIPFSPELSFTSINVLYIGIVLLLVSSLVTYMIVRRSFKMDVQASLKSETKFLDKINLLERIALKLNRDLHPFKKYIIRRAFGRKIFLAFLIIGLSVSVCFIYFSFGITDSIIYSVDKKINETDKWDGVASTWQYENESVLDNELGSVSDLDEIEFGIIDTVLFSKKKSDFDNYFRVMAYEEDAELYELEAENGVKLDKKYDAFVSKDIIQEFSLNVGSKIYIKRIASNKTWDFNIRGIVNDMTADTVFLSMNMAQKVIGVSDEFNIIYFTIKSGKDGTKVAEKIQDLSSVENVVLKEDIEESLESAMEMTNLFIVIFATMFFLFGLAIVGVIIKNLIDYRIEDYANMKALGLLDSEIRKSILKEVLIYFAISCALGLILGYWLVTVMIEAYSYQMPGLVVNIYPQSYIYFSIYTCGIIFFVLLVQFRKLKRMNITEITKAKTFG